MGQTNPRGTGLLAAAGRMCVVCDGLICTPEGYCGCCKGQLTGPMEGV